MYVRQFMTAQVFTVTPEKTIADTMALMREKKISRMPVVEKGKLVGLVTDGDLREVSPSPATTLSIFELNYLIAKTPIREVAIKKVVTCHPDTQIEDAALLMRDHKIGGLPVVDGGKVVGIITGSDIMDAFLDIMGFRSPGQRVMIETKDQVGVMLDLALSTKEFDVNIGSLAVYHLRDNQIQILARLQGDQVAEVEASLEKKGYQIKK
ncbi:MULTISPECIES: CBS domain-containing protein [Desulfosporosinus]|uniref:CBS domain-containing protein n=1 Tax=Desulfosporosinus nitroreducens TaxID=2018668 RepID=A0ABT8QRP8_9FIRM|nr:MULTISPECIES: CBS domain-containing protein [Desulfosporosinus]MCO1601438.1 CBS domain-containing protein [Desulfosporosinus nitroreducens]MDA8221841.1 CBS domain-containing protein [Desulfitobacterium hafniense]MDO0824018.1 CBS domain-containing protein [Desulfosporosinus nitroreducens]